MLTRVSRAALLTMTAALSGTAWLAPAVPARAQNLGDVFRAVNPSVVKVQGIPVGEAADHQRVRDILEKVPPGGEFTMTVLRLGQVIELKGRHP